MLALGFTSGFISNKRCEAFKQAKQVPHRRRPRLQGISFPKPLNEISKVERQNNLAINVFGWEKRVITLRISSVDPKTPRINLVLIQDEISGQSHYCHIKNLDRLLYSRLGTGNKAFFCERCLQGFSSQHVLDDYIFLMQGHKAPARNQD